MFTISLLVVYPVSLLSPWKHLFMRVFLVLSSIVLLSLCSCSSTKVIPLPSRNVAPAQSSELNEYFKKSITTVTLRNYGGSFTRDAGRIILRRDTICAYPERRTDTVFIPLQDVETIQCSPKRVLPYLAIGAVLGGMGGYAISQLAGQEKGFGVVGISVLGAIGGITVGASQVHDTEFRVEKTLPPDSTKTK